VRPAQRERLPAQLAAVNLPAAGSDMGAQGIGCGAARQRLPAGAPFWGVPADLEAWPTAAAVRGQHRGDGVTRCTGLRSLSCSKRAVFLVVLADAREVQRASGRPKSDVQDCQWRSGLHTYGCWRRPVARRARFVSAQLSCTNGRCW